MHILMPTLLQHRCWPLCLESYRLLFPEISISLVVGGSPTPEQLDRLLQYDVNLITLEENRGFTGNVNHGMSRIDDEHILLTNDDVVVLQPEALKRVEEHLANPKVAGVGPTSNYVLSHQLYRRAGPQTERVPMISFFWIGLKRSLWNEIGPLDEDFGLGLSDDLDWCCRAHNAGYHFIIDRTLLVWHFGSQTISQLTDYKEQEQANRQRLYAKHPQLCRTSA